MEKKIFFEKTQRSSKSKSTQKQSFLLRGVLMFALILAFASIVNSQHYSSNAWYSKVLSDGTVELNIPVQEQWDDVKFINYEPRVVSTLTTISYNSFANCTSLKEVTVPASVTSVGQSTFAACSSMAKEIILNFKISYA